MDATNDIIPQNAEPGAPTGIPFLQGAVALSNFRNALGKYSGAIYAHATQPSTDISSGTTTLMKPSIDFIQGIAYTPSTGSFTIQQTGTYLLIASIGWNAITGSSNDAYTYVYKNHSEYNAVIIPGLSNGASTGLLVDIALLKGGDIIQFYVLQSSGSSTHVGVNPTYFAIAKL